MKRRICKASVTPVTRGKRGKNGRTIRVTCEAASCLDLDVLSPFQGRLKTISPRNLERLKTSILKHGFSAPMFIWRRSNGTATLLDGHQRLEALGRLREEGYAIPPLPVAFIDASEESDARAKLLAITSRFGDFIQEEVDQLITSLDADLILTTVRLDAPNLIDPDGEPVITFDAPPPSVQQNQEELQRVKNARRAANAVVRIRDDTERYLVLVYADRATREAALQALGLPADERYIAAETVSLRRLTRPPVAAGVHVGPVTKTGATG